MSAVGYQYVVIRAVPDAVREEFVNVGLVVYAQQADFLCAAYDLDTERLAALAPRLPAADLERSLRVMTRVCAGETVAGVPQMPKLGQRFGWLSAPRSTVLRPGPVHGGITDDPAGTLEALMDSLVRRR